MNGIEQADALVHWFLERLASADEAHATGTLVDDGRFNRLLQVVATKAPPELINPIRPMYPLATW